MRKTNFFWGIVLIVFGVLLLLNKTLNIDLINMNYLWPLFILIPGLSMEFNFFSKRTNPGVLVPGGILTTIGLLFFFEIFTSWRFAAYTWPVYLLSVAIGLFQLYLFCEKNNGILVPVFILTLIAIMSFLTMIFGDIYHWINYSLIIPILCIALGLYILIKNRN
ncbi:LiaI-LiaF-like domain-containing protein [Haloimpatiens sp. FM7330]|uniref:LiaF transmembrane domain-containing protein n=1 Tax=Haloimpatiens sp. FM7330 TaxID=3298610 RepID=UPI0036304752